MGIRNPLVAGMFYPERKEELEKILLGFFESVKSDKKDVKGIVAPHAGYVYCGKTAASVYSSLKKNFETVVVIGPNHSGLGVGVATSLDEWKTPLGLLKPDKDFIKEIIKDSIILEDPGSHRREHSIEVQLPWLQYVFGDIKLVPISINPIYFDIKTCKEIGERLFLASKKLGRKVLLVASTDFTHYGSMYGYTPFKEGKDTIEKIKEMDMEVIHLINKLDAENVIKTCREKRLTICGYGCVASLIFAAKDLGAKRGKLVDYSTSFDISRDTGAVVGYAGIEIV